MILPAKGTVNARQCHGCGGFITDSNKPGNTTIVGIVRSGHVRAMIVVLCGACAQARLNDLRCVTCSRAEVAKLFETIAQDGGVVINGG